MIAAAFVALFEDFDMVRMGSAVFGAVLLASGSAQAARCGGDFNTFLAGMAADAQAAGVSSSVTGAALSGVSEDGNVLAFDRRQRGDAVPHDADRRVRSAEIQSAGRHENPLMFVRGAAPRGCHLLR